MKSNREYRSENQGLRSAHKKIKRERDRLETKVLELETRIQAQADDIEALTIVIERVRKPLIPQEATV